MRKILVINSSPRAGGNTQALCEAFAQGARAAGHEVEVLRVGGLDIWPCRGCLACTHGGGDPCVIADDMRAVYAAYNRADTLVFASPIYNWTFNGQMMVMNNRLFADSASKGFAIPKKECAFLLTAESDGDDVFVLAVTYYHHMLAQRGWSHLGGVTAGGVLEVGAIAEHPALDEAERLGGEV